MVSSLTCWNIVWESLISRKLQLILVVRGFDVVVDAPLGQSAWFASVATSSYLQSRRPAGRKDGVCITAYTRWECRYFSRSRGHIDWLVCRLRHGRMERWAAMLEEKNRHNR